MDISPIFKIPGLLLAAASLSFSFNPPNPINVSTKEGAVVPSTYERLMRVMFRGLGMYRACFWLASGVESAVILARAYPSLSVSRFILDSLLFDGARNTILITPASVVGIVLAVLGASLRAWCYRTLGKHFTFQLSLKKDQTLVTTGPYAIVRHPSYTGLTLAVIAVVLLYATDGSWVRESGVLHLPLGALMSVAYIVYSVVGIVTLLARIKEEEKELQKRFKEEWEAWTAEVPYLLIPGIV